MILRHAAAEDKSEQAVGHCAWWPCLCRSSLAGVSRKQASGGERSTGLGWEGLAEEGPTGVAGRVGPGGLAVCEEEAFSVGPAFPVLKVQGVVTDRRPSRPPSTQQVQISITGFELRKHRALHGPRSSVSYSLILQRGKRVLKQLTALTSPWGPVRLPASARAGSSWAANELTSPRLTFRRGRR